MISPTQFDRNTLQKTHVTEYMKKILGTVILLTATAMSSNSLAQEYSPINRLGTNEAICIGGVQTQQELQAVFVNDSKTIEQILSNSGWQGNKADLDSVIAAGDFVEKSYEPGSRFHWMAARRKNTGVALPFREWTGKKAFIGYELKVTSQCQVHTMVIPKDCCNLALMEMKPEPVAEPLVIVSTGQETVDICTEQGNEMTVIAEDGTPIDSPLDSNGCWSHQIHAGNYIVRTTNPHCCGATSTETFSVDAIPAPEPAMARTPEPKTFTPYFAGFVGREARQRFNSNEGAIVQDTSGAFGIKLGTLVRLNDNYSAFGQIGGYKLIGLNDGAVWSENNIFVDIGIERKLDERGFIGLGLGEWNIDNRDSPYDSTSYFLYGGGDIGEKKDNTQWFLEARFFNDTEGMTSDNNMITAGIRYLFK